MKNLSKEILIKILLFMCIVGVLFLPLWQSEYEYFKEKPLKGSFTELKASVLSLDSWLSAEYQEKQQKYLNENIGFRKSFVRLYNQMNYSFYDHARAKGVVVGKENYLYEKNYIKAHLGRDFKGQELIDEKVRKLEIVKDSLKYNGVDIIVVLAPGKASFYPEYIPNEYEPERITETNYHIYRDRLAESGIYLLDFNKWFIEMKGKMDFPLFPKTGIHWSKYGEVLAADSLLRFIERVRDINMPDIVVETILTYDTVCGTDDDIEDGMNLLFDIKDLKMGYPKFKIQGADKVGISRVLTVADSYYWGMFNLGLSNKGFNKGQFWYYNKQIYPDSYKESLKVEDINILTEVEKNDVILLMSTDANLYKFAFGFIDQLYAAYTNPSLDKREEKKYVEKDVVKKSKEERILQYVNAIKETPD